ncbi:hypothetical protein BV898_10257 [Hypsibius exemplaris]|uniref:Chitin-binding type-2 domain-containing protein n=1 Tax=Hypsibius exemplaris TaxID=2072580 RepID=A0A1W0WJZ7_HYPEX|nr:hypothetical protein BV898_10257 [Hypsibius exemplaris]
MDYLRRLESVVFLVVTLMFLAYLSPDFVTGNDVYYVTGADMISVTCGVGEGWYRNPFDCSKFYACVSTNVRDYFVYDHDCPEGLHYDSNRTMCDYPWHVWPPCDAPDIPSTTRRPMKYAAKFDSAPDDKLDLNN